MAGFFDFEDLFDPGDDFVGAGIRWFVQVDTTVFFEDVERAFGWGVTARERSEVCGFDVQLVKVLEKERPR